MIKLDKIRLKFILEIDRGIKYFIQTIENSGERKDVRIKIYEIFIFLFVLLFIA